MSPAIGGYLSGVMRRMAKLARRPVAAAAWWGAWWTWRNRPNVGQWTRFARAIVRDRPPLGDVTKEGRVRAAFTVDRVLRDSPEVQVSSVSGGIVHLHGVPGGPDTERAALSAARVPGVIGVEIHDKVSLVGRRRGRG